MFLSTTDMQTTLLTAAFPTLYLICSLTITLSINIL